jgi:hypothetical protein
LRTQQFTRGVPVRRYRIETGAPHPAYNPRNPLTKRENGIHHKSKNLNPNHGGTANTTGVRDLPGISSLARHHPAGDRE